MRALAFDVGRRRTGVAVSDASGVLARPLEVIAGEPLEPAVALIARLRDDSPVDIIVVGWPRRLDGSANEQTAFAEAFAQAIGARAGLPVFLQDERLTSVEAESRLARGERDWRARKKRLDAAAAAIVLQDFLDARAERHSDALATRSSIDDE